MTRLAPTCAYIGKRPGGGNGRASLMGSESHEKRWDSWDTGTKPRQLSQRGPALGQTGTALGQRNLAE